MSSQVFAMMLSSDKELWRKCQDVLGPNYLIMLLPAENIEQSKQAICEQELVILDVFSDEEKWIKKIRAVRKILGKGKAFFVFANLPRDRKHKIINAGADECFSRLDSPQLVVSFVSNLIKRYRLEQK